MNAASAISPRCFLVIPPQHVARTSPERETKGHPPASRHEQDIDPPASRAPSGLSFFVIPRRSRGTCFPSPTAPPPTPIPSPSRTNSTPIRHHFSPIPTTEDSLHQEFVPPDCKQAPPT